MGGRTDTLFSVSVRVPASSANLGPGFDCLGLALTLFNTITLTGHRAGPSLSMVVAGEGAAVLPLDQRNLVVRVIKAVFAKAKQPLPPLSLRLNNQIPLARGLGSSSAAIVGGLVAANEALGRPFNIDQLLTQATDWEGHPDNVAPALMGGLCTATLEGPKPRALAWTSADLFRDLRAVVAVPEFELSTKKARAVLPARYSKEDAVFNVSRATFLLGLLLSKKYDALGLAMDDRLHQPYRRKLIPGFDAVLSAARRAGAYGAALSGAGPTLLAFCAPKKSSAVAQAMVKSFSRAGVVARAHVLRVDTLGARLEKLRR